MEIKIEYDTATKCVLLHIGYLTIDLTVEQAALVGQAIARALKDAKDNTR